ncbi:MAG: hypothetical protein ACRCX4_06955 [Bacteroidales bacterium]
MATNDLKTNLKLDSSDFDRGIQRGRRQVKQFQSDTKTFATQAKDSFGLAVGAAGAFATALVGVNGISAAFDTLKGHNQAFGDSWNNTMEGCKATFDSFVENLINADLSMIGTNFAAAFKAGVDEAKAYDTLGNTKMSYGVASARKLDQISDLDAKLSKEKDTDKRATLIAERNALLADLRKYVGTLSSDVIDALGSGVNTALGGVFNGNVSKNFTEDMFIRASEIDLDKDNRDSARAASEQFYKEFNKSVNPFLKKIGTLEGNIAEVKFGETGASMTSVERGKEVQRLQGMLSENYKGINQYFSELSDVEKQHLLNYVTLMRYSDEKLQGVYNELQGVFNSNRVINRLAKREPKAEVSSGTGKSGKTVVNNVDTSEFDLYRNIQLYINPTTEFERIQKAINQHDSLNWVVELTAEDEAGDSFDFNNKKNPLENISNIDVSEQIGQFTSIATAIGSITGAINEGANSWSSWIASLLGSIATAIPAIKSLTIAMAAKSAAETPIVGWLTVGAAVASVGAVLASMPKYATGGIVSGATVSGDKIPALMNAGEMVLNGSQQSRLFNMLNGGNNNNNATMTNVEFKVSGKDLIGVLNNYSKATGKR